MQPRPDHAEQLRWVDASDHQRRQHPASRPELQRQRDASRCSLWILPTGNPATTPDVNDSNNTNPSGFDPNSTITCDANDPCSIWVGDSSAAWSNNSFVFNGLTPEPNTTPLPPTQTITWTPPTSGTVGTSTTLSATGGASGNPVVFSVDSSSGSGVCNVTGTNGTTLHYTAAGTCVVDANQAGNSTYSAAPQVQAKITVSSQAQAQLSVSPSTVAPGGKVQLTFSGFPPDASVVLHVGSPTGTVLGTFKMGSNGGLVTGELTVKSTYKAGKYNLFAVGGGDTAETSITIS